jgi:hypothetical protein
LPMFPLLEFPQETKNNIAKKKTNRANWKSCRFLNSAHGRWRLTPWRSPPRLL